MPCWGSILVGAAAAGASIAGAPLVLGGLGFTAGGVAVGSVAAGVQSTLYGGMASGAFSVLQAAGAAGIGGAGKTVIGTVAGAAASKIYECTIGCDV
ncbi:interferon alpha-inducible protein 27-like protein 2B [Hydractinia symbiolongicarpus]|uniref:interferon alpha-inducible protein 27-like protein 2B n=1 Tax=Hydractinia symbiolongicarpus TaxID=13093 RepID=UPI00254FB075|nr:interferon alpha-inducible protein 27-like protein 2B [Hydractinia symbiolongicarpus]XP_057293901.1 interferon alpha-inducible protein 27-like protein 2B [Hydractinia symbiolongicarpus]